MGSPVVHFEVIGTDARRLQSFYGELFGWKFDTDNPMGYGMVHREGNTVGDGLGIGGGVGAAPPGAEGHVTFYVGVPDPEATLASVERLGGKRLFGPDRVTDEVEIGAFTDPEGHMIGVMRSAH